ncbi:DUF185-domain-containing protein [Cristinia sonorae]|uniref:Protein arginine methyltransferase NDUFAF7 n=1 Tax=Cristinia sonorae TaxID=1940300 RepID=A0A8K0UNL0_9AGAR|nr:DUF185-domain-containing protein [Cristinia sonorae]
MKNCLVATTRLATRCCGQGSRSRFQHIRTYATGGPLVGSQLPPVTKVEQIIMDTIKSTGPISFATYMQMCLSHPTAGYYMNPSNAVFGTKGDFITSPEISQVFGELVGVWLTHQYLNSSGSKPIRIVELGPGRGTLMNDILRVLATFKLTRAAVKEVHLVETSASMRATQERLLGALARGNGWQIHWHDSLEEVSRDVAKFTMVVAHEFFDALPFHLLQKTHHGWQEVLISLTPDPAAPVILRPSDTPPTTASSSAPPKLSSRFHHALSPSPTASATLLGLSSTRFQKLPVGSRIEVSPTSFKIAHQIGELIKTEDNTHNPGCSLIVDYGGDHVFGNSFRAFKNHKIVDVFHRPGESDLTTNVDFGYLKEALSANAFPLGPISQAQFLVRMGLTQRVQKLQQAANDPERSKVIGSAAERLIDPTGMGSQYKVLGVSGYRAPDLSADERNQVDYPFIEG